MENKWKKTWKNPKKTKCKILYRSLSLTKVPFFSLSNAHNHYSSSLWRGPFLVLREILFVFGGSNFVLYVNHLPFVVAPITHGNAAVSRRRRRFQLRSTFTYFPPNSAPPFQRLRRSYVCTSFERTFNANVAWWWQRLIWQKIRHTFTFLPPM